MVDPKHPLTELLARDRRYRFDAYVFVFEALHFAQEKLGMGDEYAAEQLKGGEFADDDLADDDADDILNADNELEGDDLNDGDLEDQLAAWSAPAETQRHVSGQELCQAIRLYAQQQYGYLAKSVLNHWGITSTNDFGEIVFNLIEVEQMRKTPEDRREDFDSVYDFDQAFQYSFEFSSADSSEEPRL